MMFSARTKRETPYCKDRNGVVRNIIGELRFSDKVFKSARKAGKKGILRTGFLGLHDTGFYGAVHISFAKDYCPKSIFDLWIHLLDLEENARA